MYFLRVFVVLLLSILSVVPSQIFVKDLFHIVLNGTKSNNVVISPSSIREALAQVYLGAEGRTALELQSVLQLLGSTKKIATDEFRLLHNAVSSSKGVKLKVANRLYVASDVTISLMYKWRSWRAFKTRPIRINFAQSERAAAIINEWIAGQTENKIKRVIEPNALSGDTKFVIVSAIYFYGKWEYGFPNVNTKPRKFYMENKIGKTKFEMNIPMMSLTEYLQTGYVADLDADIVSLPYQNSNISMMIILPRKWNGISKLQDNLDALHFRSIESTLYRRQIQFTMPKFKVEFQIKLKEPLESMGIRKIFQNPEFRSLTSYTNPLPVASVVHKAKIEVDEAGTEAAAATVVETVDPSLVDSDPIHAITVDHAFLFAIRDEQTVHFIGRVSHF